MRRAIAVAGACLALALVACSVSQRAQVRPAIASYLAASDVELNQCRECSGNREGNATVNVGELAHVSECSIRAEARLASYYDDALRSVRYQRGTSMYLKLHHEQWVSALRIVCERSASAVERVKALKRLERLQRELDK